MNHGSRNGWVWDRAVSKAIYGAVRGRLPLNLGGLFKIRDYTCENAVRWVVAVQMLSPVKAGFPWDIHGHVTVPLRVDAGRFTTVDIATIHGQRQLILEGKWRWLENSRIDLGTFNEGYEQLGIWGAEGRLPVSAYPSTRTALP